MMDVRAVWSAVLRRGLLDALGVGIITGGGPSGAERRVEIQMEALEWMGSEDFEEVCGMAGACPFALRAAWRCGRLPEALVEHEQRTPTPEARARWALAA